jgi:CRISPR/Cas system-associated exonuclease Cas4 (RecB family)
MTVVQGSTRVNLYPIEYEKIKAEASQASVPMSKILKDYALEYIKLKNDTEDTKGEGIIEGSLIHTIISKMEVRIAKTIETNSEQLRESALEVKTLKAEIQIIAAILDNYIKFYLNHTPEVPVNERAERSKSSMLRYQRFLLAVKSALKNGNAKVISEVQNLILNELHDI